MNKLLIPAILVATVMVAGIFAFIPVEQATTIHTIVVADLQGAGGQDHDAVIANTDAAETAILLDLEEKIKLSEDFDGPTALANGDGGTSTITIEALDDGANTTFNLKECYLEGTSDNSGGDDILVEAITIDGTTLHTDADQTFADFGASTDAGAVFGTTMVELLSGLGFDGLGAGDTITMTVRVDDQELINQIQCIAFVQNSADLVVTITDPAGGE